MAPKRKFTPETEAEIRYERSRGVSQDNLARQYGTTQSVISKIIAEGDKPAAEAVAPAIPPPRDGMLWLDPAAIKPSNFNPRKTFDDESLDTLQESIATNGLLQNLVVAPPDFSGQYQLVAGERRLRVINRLVAQGRWTGFIPCRLVTDDLLGNIAIALLENIQRVDVPPIEEAEAFLRLIDIAPAIWTTATIAERIGRTQRYVQQRIVLATKLSPLAREALIDRRITIEGARILATHDEATQTEVMEDFNNEDRLEIGVDELTQYLPNFNARPAPLSDFAPNEPVNPVNASPIDDDAADDDQPLEQARLFDQAPHAPEPTTGAPFTKDHIYHAHKRKAAAMQKAVAGDHVAALRIACLAFLIPQESILITRADDWRLIAEDRSVPHPDVEAVIHQIMGKTKTNLPAGDHKGQVAVWNHIAALKYPDLECLFDALVARATRNPAGYDCTLGDSPLSLAIAHSLKIPGCEDENGLTMQREDLTGLRKSLLLKIADDSDTPGVNDATPIAELIKAIATKSKDREYVIPTLRFGTTAEIEQAVSP